MPLSVQKAELFRLHDNTKGKVMIRKTIKAVLVAGQLAIAASALAVEQPLPIPPPGISADAESSETVPILTGGDRCVRLTLDFVPALSNAVQVAFGQDENADGDLAPDETRVVFGVDCGEPFVREEFRRGRGQSLAAQFGLVDNSLGGQGLTAAPEGLTAAPRMTSPQLQTETEPSVLHDSSFQVQTSWTARGAYCDWTRVDFPDGFAFPHGTNLVTAVTLMAYGEIRENLRCSPSDFALSLPLPVSLEPGVSACAYGLTASNSFVFAWTDVCVERSPTNRVDAAIELFASGDMQVRFGESVTNIVARPPEGFVGIGQDAAWVTNAFPGSAADIAEKGYEDWLMEDCVGHNAPNGIYRLSVTVAALPEHGPCYLVVGPYKTVVTQPGTYDFPLEEFVVYRAYACPTRVPLSFSYDDGFSDDETDLCMSAPRRMLTGSPHPPNEYEIYHLPRVIVKPSRVTLGEAEGTTVSLLYNFAGELEHYFVSTWGTTQVIFRGSRTAEIVRADMADEIWFNLENMGHRIGGVLYIDNPPPPNDQPPRHQCCNACCGDSCRCDGTCCLCSCSCHSSTNGCTNTTDTAP